MHGNTKLKFSFPVFAFVTFYPNPQCCNYLHNPYKYFPNSLVAVNPSFHALMVKLGSPFVGIDAENSLRVSITLSTLLDFFSQSIAKVALHLLGHNFEISLCKLINDFEFIKINYRNLNKLESDMLSVWIQY